MNLPKICDAALEAIQVGVEQCHPISNLEQLGVTQRLINLLESNGIVKLGDLMYTRKEELLKFRNLGEKQLELIFNALDKYHRLD